MPLRVEVSRLRWWNVPPLPSASEAAAPPNCDQTCPGAVTPQGSFDNCNNRSGHGACNLSSLTCSCAVGFVGAACQYQCPGRFQGEAFTCGGHGVCSATAAGTASQCTCLSSAATGFWALDSHPDGSTLL